MFVYYYYLLCRVVMGIGSGGQGAWPPGIFIHGTNTVDRGLKVLFFGVCCYFSGFFSLEPPLEIVLPTPLRVILRTSKF